MRRIAKDYSFAILFLMKIDKPLLIIFLMLLIKKIFFLFIVLIVFNKYLLGQSIQKQESKIDSTSKYSPLKICGYFNLLGNDFKEQFTAPFKMNNKQLINLGLFTCTAAVIFSTDPYVDAFARKEENKNPFIKNISPTITNFGNNYAFITVGALEATGIIFNDKKLETAGILVTQSLITSAVFNRFGKVFFGRERPRIAYNTPSYDNGGIWHGVTGFLNYVIKNKKIPGSDYDAFPSGHTTTAFSIATVYASMYQDQIAVPVISYTVASLVGLSRIAEHDHWGSDVFVGAALGFLCGKQVVNNYKKINQISAAHRHHKDISLSLNYYDKNYFAGMTYRF